VRRYRGIAAGALVLALASPARAGDAPDVRTADSFLARLRREVRAALEEASRLRAARPPVPVAVTWKRKPPRLASIDLGAPLLALTAGDLDGDGRAEIAAVTERHVVVLAARGRSQVVEIARIAVPADAPVIRPRDAVGSATVVAGAGRSELLARASTAARGARYALDGGALREIGSVAGFPVCGEQALELAPGRNTFVSVAGGRALYGQRCRDDLVDPQGRPLRVDAELAEAGALAVTLTVTCAPRDAGCGRARTAVRTLTLTGVGTAFEIADVDRDGRPEIIHAGAGAPGDADAIAIDSLPRSGTALDKPVFRRGFTGGVAGVVAADLDADGDVEVLAAVRLPGAQKVDLWLLN
jgi:hypothetical protein